MKETITVVSKPSTMESSEYYKELSNTLAALGRYFNELSETKVVFEERETRVKNYKLDTQFVIKQEHA